MEPPLRLIKLNFRLIQWFWLVPLIGKKEYRWNNRSTKQLLEQIIQSWKQSSPNIYIWDYTTQYTNYYDLFPNLPALQKDLQYFQKRVTGVFEHGSEEHYSCLDDYKSFMISHWLWNPNLPLDSLKYVFFENAYPQNADYLAEFITAIETKQTPAKILLPIYGNIKHSIPGYMSLLFDLFFYELNKKKISQSTGKEKIIRTTQTSVAVQ